MSVTLLHVWRAAGQRSVALSSESAGYLVLSVREALSVDPVRLELQDLLLQPDGSVRLSGPSLPDAHAAPESLRRLLEQLLDVASSVGPALARVAARSQPASVSAFAKELETALIPVNRAAARRALVRLARETARVGPSVGEERPEPPPPSPKPPTPVEAVERPLPRVHPRNEPFPSEGPSLPDPVAWGGPEPGTPQLGSFDVEPVAAERLVAPPDDLTEHVPFAEELFADDGSIDVDFDEPVDAPQVEARPVTQLLEAFEVGDPMSETDLRHQLKAIAGVELTPGPGARGGS